MISLHIYVHLKKKEFHSIFIIQLIKFEFVHCNIFDSSTKFEFVCCNISEVDDAPNIFFYNFMRFELISLVDRENLDHNHLTIYSSCCHQHIVFLFVFLIGCLHWSSTVSKFMHCKTHF